ncbi:hypothetical protein DPMN_166178 [Dreissena polymorpha]|uniref:Uncharacterized protein n=1 Tax=Dreissena polymorpha TaxID=45954 RepID=A0A9D4EY71_DREPO|nr:hypothetical protein DPMN_166178 [Dreissena polymorpha]
MVPVGGIVRRNAKTASRVHDIIVPEIYTTRTYLLKRAQLDEIIKHNVNDT